MLDNFVAIDVETANNHPTSICAIGAVKVIDGVVADTFYELVNPEPDYYFRYFTQQVHGIGPDDTADARTFGEVWPDVSRFCGVLPLVAHNKAFDERCIRAACRCYGLEYDRPEFLCTLTAARQTIPKTLVGSYSLPVLAQFMGIPSDRHHNALADAMMCAKIAMAIL